MKTSSKLNAQYLGQLLKQHGCRTVVIAPGSRNAPLIITFSEDEDYRCLSVPDERAAAFTALGLAIGQNSPVAVICSSGSAVVNFYPAVVEAFYQKLPLVVISADRPRELIDQGVGQTIRQEGVFKNHIAYEANLQRDPQDEMARKYNQRLINAALLATRQGPVHINVPFDEPLYDTASAYAEKLSAIKLEAPTHLRADSSFAKVWDKYSKVMLLVGQMPPRKDLGEAMDALNEHSPFLILSESVSNLAATGNICSIDRLINSISDEEKRQLAPELLITMGGEVVSKMVKQFVKEHPPKEHWHLSPQGELRDTFQLLSGVVMGDETAFFEDLLPLAKSKGTDYRDYWLEADQKRSETQKAFLQQAPFSDLTAFGQVLEVLPENSILHMANSASVRYAQLFDHDRKVKHYANRGTSGIDGCSSTAVGHALATDSMLTLITGDIAFLYDSNAFWNDSLPPNLRVVVLNNAGGNIFRIIKGPEKTEAFEQFQETVHSLNLKGVADIHGLDFKSVENREELGEVLASFYEASPAARILEIKTPRLENPEVLKDYFGYLKQSPKP